jgi:predicted Zn-dependent peptidase
MQFHSHKLSNGLHIIGETNPAVRSMAVGFYVKTGSRDETPEEAGVSHFLEHMMFKGTERRQALDVNLDFDRIGAKANAYTSEENTVYHTRILPEYLPQAVDILSDILRPSLRQDDFDTEKKVIISEIARYEDNPMMTAYEHARKHYFGSHSLGNSVLGTTASVGALTREQMLHYFERRYAADNVIAAAAGNFDWDQFVSLVEKACRGWNRSNVQPRKDLVEVSGPGGMKTKTKDSLYLQQYVIMSAGPKIDVPTRYAADVVAVALGDYSGSRFYWSLIDPGLVESVDTSYYINEGNGVYITFVCCQPERSTEVLSIVEKVLAEIQQQSFTDEEIQTAKTKIASRLVRAGERPMGRMESIAACWTYLHEYRDITTEMNKFESVTAHDVSQVLKSFPLVEKTTFAYGPLGGE